MFRKRREPATPSRVQSLEGGGMTRVRLIDTECDWTYEQWQKAGYQVKRGEKSEARNEVGQPTFSFDQVKESYDEPDDWEYENDWMFDTQHHYGWGSD